MTHLPLKLYFRDKVILFSGLAAFLCNLVIWFYLLLAIPATGSAIFLHYTVHFGVDLVGGWADIFSLPILGLCIVAINMVLSFFLSSNRLISRLLVVAAAVIQVILLIQAFFLKFLNT